MKKAKKARALKIELAHQNDTPKKPKTKIAKPKEVTQNGGTTAEQRLEYWKKRANDTLSRSWELMSLSQAETLEMLRHAGADTTKVKNALTVLGVSMAQLVNEVNTVTLLKVETPKESKGGSHAETIEKTGSK